MIKKIISNVSNKYYNNQNILQKPIPIKAQYQEPFPFKELLKCTVIFMEIFGNLIVLFYYTEKILHKKGGKLFIWHL